MVNLDSKSEPRATSHLRDKVKTLVRDELLQAAEEVFADEGLQAAKVESIASRAGVSVGTVYNYFADRKALLDAVIDHRKGALVQELLALATETEGRPFLERLNAMLKHLLEHFQSQRPYFLLMLQAEGASTTMLKQAVSDPCQGPFGPVFSHMEAIVEQGIREGVLRNEAPRPLTRFLVGITRGMGIAALMDPAAPDIRENRETILRYFLHGAGPLRDQPTSSN